MKTVRDLLILAVLAAALLFFCAGIVLILGLAPLPETLRPWAAPQAQPTVTSPAGGGAATLTSTPVPAATELAPAPGACDTTGIHMTPDLIGIQRWTNNSGRVVLVDQKPSGRDNGPAIVVAPNTTVTLGGAVNTVYILDFGTIVQCREYWEDVWTPLHGSVSFAE